jgi:hypothetical protein
MSEHDPNLDFITAAERRVQADLLVGDWFQGVTVLTNANGDLDAKIREAVAGLGLFIVITVGKGPVPNLGDSEPWECVIVIAENSLLNRSGSGATGKTARMAVQKIIARAASATSIHLTQATEIVAEDGVTWQLTGEVTMAMAPA